MSNYLRVSVSFFTAIIVVVTMSGCSLSKQHLPWRNEQFLLSQDEMIELSKRAHQHDSDAAYRVYMHFSYGCGLPATGAIYYEWAKDLGHPECTNPSLLKAYSERYKKSRK